MARRTPTAPAAPCPRRVVAQNGWKMPNSVQRASSSPSQSPRSRRRRRPPRRPGQPEVLELRHRHPQVLPPRRVVARPVHRVALEARVAGARDDKRAALRPQRPDPRASAWAIHWPYEVVDLRVQPRPPSPWWTTSSGIVDWLGTNRVGSFMSHQMPATPASSSREWWSPHHARVRGLVKSGKAQMPGPDDVAVLLARGVLQKRSALAALEIDLVAGVDLHARVDNRDHPEALVAERRDQPRGIREAFVVPREDAVAVHVVDVEVEHVAGDAARAELGRDLAHLVGALVAPARLLVAERPQRRHRRCARSARCSARARRAASDR